MEIPVTPLSYKTLAFWVGGGGVGVNCSADCCCVGVKMGRRECASQHKRFVFVCVCVFGWRSGSSAAVTSVTRLTGGSQSSECAESQVWESESEPWGCFLSTSFFFFFSGLCPTWFQAFWHIRPNTHGFCQRSPFSHPTKPPLPHVIGVLLRSKGRKGCSFNWV